MWTAATGFGYSKITIIRPCTSSRREPTVCILAVCQIKRQEVKKVKFTLKQATKAHRGSKGTAVLFL
jgi:hypothetical protein